MVSLVTRLRLIWREQPLLVVYVAAALACLGMAGLELAILALFGALPAYLLFAPVVCGAAVMGGRGAGLMTTALALALTMTIGLGGDAMGAGVFALLGVGVSLAGDWVFRARRDGERASHVLAEREAHLRSIYDTAPDALIVIDRHGIVQSFSAAAERIFGWSASEVLGRDVKMLLPEPFREAHQGYVDSYMRTGKARIIGIGRIVVGQRKDGSTFPLELAVGEVRSERGRFFTGFLRDLTERQAREARLQELQSELVQMSRLTAMGEMASALAHELNQPLSAIANYINGARRLMERAGGGDERVSDALDKASAQALRAGEIIRRLRDFLGRGEPERGVHALPKLVREACALALVGAKERGVRMSYDFDARANFVLADRVPVQQVVINLVLNAIDAMADQPKRELKIATSLGEDGFAVVSVSDTGAGIDPAAADRLFQPFVTTKSKGMGVGLSISRTIVESHGGRIWTEPNPGGGAIFRFSLRLVSEDEAAEQAHA